MIHYAVATVCAYEVLAICSGGRIPTLSYLDRKHKHIISAAIFAGLAAHFYVEVPHDNQYPDQWRLRLR